MERSTLFASAVCASFFIIAGCESGDRASSGEQEAAQKSVDALLDLQNIQPSDINYGDLPSVKGPSGYKAEFDALAYFGVDADAQFMSTVRYFKAAGNDYPAIKASILACVARLDADMAAKCDNELAASTFDEFTFRAPTNVVFVARNPTLKFQTAALVFSKSLDRVHPDYGGGTKAKPNKSFYNEQIFTEGARQLVYVSNYYSKKSGNNDNARGVGDAPITKAEKYWYGLNIFMTIEQQGGNPIRIIIDPDTGNMGGYP